MLEKYRVRCARGIFTSFALLMMVLIWRIEQSFFVTCAESKNSAGDDVELFDNNEGEVAETQQPLIEVNSHGIVDNHRPLNQHQKILHQKIPITTP